MFKLIFDFVHPFKFKQSTNPSLKPGHYMVKCTNANIVYKSKCILIVYVFPANVDTYTIKKFYLFLCLSKRSKRATIFWFAKNLFKSQNFRLVLYSSINIKHTNKFVLFMLKKLTESNNERVQIILQWSRTRGALIHFKRRTRKHIFFFCRIMGFYYYSCTQKLLSSAASLATYFAN